MKHGSTELCQGVAGVLSNFNLNESDVYVHSQGALAMRNAINEMTSAGVDMGGMSVHYNGAPVNRRNAERHLQSVGAEMGRFEAHAFDPVPQILGGNTINPVKITGSVLASPLLFVGNDWSTHTFRGGGKHINRVTPRAWRK